MKKTILTLAAIITLGVLFASQAYYPNRILFSLKHDEQPLTKEQLYSLDTPYPELNRLIKKYDIVKIEPWLPNAKETDHDGDVYLNRIYRLTAKTDLPSPNFVLNEFSSGIPAVQSAEQEAIMRTHAIPDDPMIGDQWYLYRAQVQEAWTLWDLEGGETPGNNNIVVAVVDDGVEYTHPDLWKNIWINQDEIPDTYFSFSDANSDGFITAEEAVAAVGDINGNGVTDLKDVIATNSFLTDGLDNDGDGYVDNLIGWDTDEDGASSDDDRDPMVTNNSHGTHVAGLVGATTNNNTGIASAAYNVSIMPVKATGDETSLSINTGWNGILYAAQAGANIINCSWGGPGYSSYAQNIINNVYDNYGTLVIAAAGNGDDDGNASDEPHYPSGYDHVVSVTAVNSQDHFSWANYGAASGNFYGVDLSAPGESMLSTYLTKQNSYAYLAGTSMASPFVASCFALLKSVYPDSSNEWLTERILSNTDPIDDLNPDYAGQIGTGRINILKALVSDQWPSLSVKNTMINITSGDGDSKLNPGESINLMLEVENDTGWAAASNVLGILRTNEDGISISDSMATWSSVPQNTSAFNDGNGFSLSFSADLRPGNYEFELLLESTTDESMAYSFKRNFTIALTLDQVGFPFMALTEVEASPLFADIDNDRDQEIFFGDNAGNIYGVDHTGDTLSGFPVSIGTQIIGVALADLDLDDTLEIVVTGFDKVISMFDVYGRHEWTRHTNLFSTAMPAIGNIDGDPELEVLVGSYDQNLYAFNHDSTNVAGFPYAIGQILQAGVALADIDSDGLDEIVYTANSGTVGALDITADSVNALWSATTSGSIACEPQVLINNDGTGIILFGNDVGDMYGYDLEGAQIFMLEGEGAIKASPAIYIQNGFIFAFYGTTSGYLYKLNVWSGGGSLYKAWTKKISPVYKSLILADLFPYDMSNTPHVLAIGNNGYIYAYHENDGSPMVGFPVNTRALSKSSLASVDIDNDGDLELINGSYSGLSVTDLKMTAGNVHWPMHRGFADRSGSMRMDGTGIEDIDVLENTEFELVGNYPNPFNPTTTIKYKVGEISPVTLTVYSLNGRRIMSREIGSPEIGLNKVEIDMSSFSSGMYIYKMQQGKTQQSAKMLLLK